MKLSAAYKNNWAYAVGLAIGDGNLSNSNGRAVRLRITCDIKYPLLIQRIKTSLKILLPDNKVSLVIRDTNCVDVSVYSNKLEFLLGWKAKEGSKFKQKVRVPSWIKENKKYYTLCLRGLFETDGSIYMDRGYLMANFVTVIPELSLDVTEMIMNLGFTAHCYKIELSHPNKTRYNIRISKNTKKFTDTIGLVKN